LEQKRSNPAAPCGWKRHFSPEKGLAHMNGSARFSPFRPSLRAFAAGAVLLYGVCLAGAQAPYRFDAATVSGLPARNIGSATMSGRIAALDGVEEDGRIIVFVGAASGGVWKSVNGGTTYKPVFDREDVQSIGAIAIDPSNSKTVWVGTGEAWMRNSVSVGDGVYKSTDGGENWTNVGLKDSEHVAKILVNPTDGSDVLACATGHLWDDNDERGVFRTTDGGKTWNKVLAGANGSSGCAMIASSKQEPKTIYAAMWDFRRQGWTAARIGAKSPTATLRVCRPSRGAALRCRWRPLNRERFLRTSKRKREEDFTGPTTEGRHGPRSMPAITWCGARFISAI
jgi:hypothetical protein